MYMELVCRRPTTLWGRRYKVGETVDVTANDVTWDECGGDIEDWIAAYGTDEATPWSISWPRLAEGVHVLGRDIARDFVRVVEE
jgi:hypothetical protein